MLPVIEATWQSGHEFISQLCNFPNAWNRVAKREGLRSPGFIWNPNMRTMMADRRVVVTMS